MTGIPFKIRYRAWLFCAVTNDRFPPTADEGLTGRNVSKGRVIAIFQLIASRRLIAAALPGSAAAAAKPFAAALRALITASRVSRSCFI